MSMTESEATAWLKYMEGRKLPYDRAENRRRLAYGVAIKALEEIQQYRAIGTVSEFRELKEKATAKKPVYSDFDENENEEIIPYKAVCPACGYEFEFGTWNDEQNHHCECGQRMSWG